jgi:hypothetical protein
MGIPALYSTGRYYLNLLGLFAIKTFKKSGLDYQSMPVGARHAETQETDREL